MNDLTSMLELAQPLISAMGGDHGKILAFVVWVGSVKTLIFPFATVVQNKLTEVLNDVRLSPEQDDDALVESVLKNRAYRFGAYVIKWLTSFKLPTMQSWEATKGRMI